MATMEQRPSKVDRAFSWLSMAALVWAVGRLSGSSDGDRPGRGWTGGRSEGRSEGGANGSSTARAASPAGDGPGRHAEGPADIPATGWKDILWRVWGEVQKDRILAVAAGVTFYGLLAIFPAIAALVSLYGLVADPADISAHLQALSGFLPAGALDIVREQVERVASQGGGTLGLKLGFSLLISLWSANSGMKAIFDALNVAYGETEKRSFIKLNAMSLLFTLCALIGGIVALIAVVVVPLVLDMLGLGAVAATLISVLRWPLVLLIVLFALAVLYRYGPSRDEPQWRWVSWGSAFAAIGWLVVSLLFSWYVANFGSYDKTYGSLGAAIGFMTWIWLSTTVILIGAELNAEMEHQTAKDTTAGRPKPLGGRGAAMADTVGQATD
jgi:membrane protein